MTNARESTPLFSKRPCKAKKKKKAKLSRAYSTLGVRLEPKDKAGSAVLGNGLGGDVAVAGLATLLGAVDGLGMGTLIFPAGTPARYMSLAMSLGLLTSFVVNLALLFGSQFRFAVGGATIPQVAVMSSYFKTLGPHQPHTILVAMPLITMLGGAATYAAGRYAAGSIDALHKCVPAVVLGGFWTATGAALLEYGLSMSSPAFEGFLANPLALFSSLQSLKLWLPGFGGAVLIFTMDRVRVRGGEATLSEAALGKYAPFLLIIVLSGLTGFFFIILFATGGTLEEAREAGWLLPVQMPNGLNFYQVWTAQDFGDVQLIEFCSAQFVFAVISSFLLGMLTVMKNIAGIADAVHMEIDVGAEVRLCGLTNIVCGLCATMPGNLVGSYTRTAHRLKTRSKRRFLILLALFSGLCFICGEYVIATVPRMVPGCALIWLGFVLSVGWLWDNIYTISRIEVSVIWAMVVVELAMGAGPMVAAGIFAALVLPVDLCAFYLGRAQIYALKS